MSPSRRLRLHLDLSLARGESARGRAEGFAREQTVELDPAGLPARLRREVVGRVEEVEERGAARARAVVSFAPEVAAGDLPQLLNLLFGNVSMQRGVRVAGVDWPARFVDAPGAGPRFGIAGLHALTGVAQRPLGMVALKPLGLSPTALARLAGRLARGGVDLVKDDHSLCDQPWAPFAERVARCQEAVMAANAATGGRALYLPNLTGPVDRLGARVELLERLGVRAALVAPLLVGLDTTRALAAPGRLALIAHPSLGGALVGRRHGFAPALLWGDLFRLAGCDAVVYPNAGARFRIALADCLAVAARLRAPLGRLAPALPVLGGQLDSARVARWRRRYGPETAFLVGAGVLARPDVERAAAELRAALEAEGAPP